jgi:hypothetical protein
MSYILRACGHRHQPTFGGPGPLRADLPPQYKTIRIEIVSPVQNSSKPMSCNDLHESRFHRLFQRRSRGYLAQSARNEMTWFHTTAPLI